MTNAGYRSTTSWRAANASCSAPETNTLNGESYLGADLVGSDSPIDGKEFRAYPRHEWWPFGHGVVDAIGDGMWS
jgi:hypothetical protein